jgi:hypothetical protein
VRTKASAIFQDYNRVLESEHDGLELAQNVQAETRPAQWKRFDGLILVRLSAVRSQACSLVDFRLATLL